MKKLILTLVIILPLFTSAQKGGMEVGYMFDSKTVNGIILHATVANFTGSIAHTKNCYDGFSNVAIGYNVFKGHVKVLPTIGYHKAFNADNTKHYFDYGIYVKAIIPLRNDDGATLKIGYSKMAGLSVLIGFCIIKLN